ncbi:MAG: DUF3048 domain-containing protein [Patescibacteria group bacterium]|nr:DUF3048 domain-containing protein [Patescibacteria group bacterium]
MSRKFLLTLLLIYIVSSLASFSVFSFTGGGSGSVQLGSNQDDGAGQETALSYLLDIDPNELKDQACPLNGALYTATEQTAWAKRRPLAVMIENSVDARPQSGLNKADIVFEAIAEGGVTRFMSIFLCAVQSLDTTIAPVRSARTYFVDWASGFNEPMYVHVGGANLSGPADALGQLAKYGWNLENDMNQFSIGYPTFVRNHNRLGGGRQLATEHTMETSSELLWAVAEDRDWTNMSPERKLGRTVIKPTSWYDGYQGWSFQDEAPVVGNVTKIAYDFWEGYGQYSVAWQYDATTNSYVRSQGGETHIDLNTGEQIKASNVVVLLTAEKGPIDELKHMLYTTTGKGNALIFKNGGVEKATWSKKDREAELVFKSAKGTDIEFARGLIWISVLDINTDVEY